MKLRVNIAQWEWWYEDYIEIESAGIPRKGDKLILGFKNCRKLEGVILRNYNVAKTYGFLIYKFGDTVSLDMSDIDIVHDVDWLADEETGVLECYVHLGDDIDHTHCRFYKYMEKEFTEEDYNKAVERWKERQK
jgi:hypothetical protein